jgi:hypothetical protein
MTETFRTRSHLINQMCCQKRWKETARKVYPGYQYYCILPPRNHDCIPTSYFFTETWLRHRWREARKVISLTRSDVKCDGLAIAKAPLQDSFDENVPVRHCNCLPIMWNMASWSQTRDVIWSALLIRGQQRKMW